MDYGAIFRSVVTVHLQPWLKERGFDPKGTRFVKWVNRNCQVIGLRRSRLKDPLIILVDLGILSERIWKFYVRTHQWLPNGGMLPRFPDAADCHWRTSLHEPRLVPAFANRPWTIRQPAETNATAEGIKGVLATHAIPALDRYVSDEALRDHWLKTPLFASTEIQHLSYLGALVGDLGPLSALPGVIEAIEALPYNRPAVEAMVAELRRIVGGRDSA